MNIMWLFVISLIGGCAVEAGNPTSKTPKGIVKLEFLQASNLSGEQFTLHLDGVYLRSTKTQEVIPVTLEKSDLQLYASDAKDTQLNAGEGEFPVGSYDRVVIRLPQRKPPRYRNALGVESEVSIDTLTDQSFYLEDSINIEDGKTTVVSVNLDPVRSLSQPIGDSKDFRFIPRGGVFGHHRPLKYEGTTTVNNASIVCAYAYDFERKPILTGVASLDSNPPPRPREFGPLAQPPKVYDSRADIDFDSNTACDHAFAKAQVLEGKYSLMHLPPGKYAIRIFREDASFVDQAGDIEIKRNPK